MSQASGPRPVDQPRVSGKKIADDVKIGLTLAKAFSRPIATQIEKAPKFWKAEEYHQKYYQLRNKKPYCHLVPFAEEK